MSGRFLLRWLSGCSLHIAPLLQARFQQPAIRASLQVEELERRLAPAGGLDLTFGTGGKVTTAFSSFTDAARAITIDSSDRPIVVGSARGPANADFAIARYDVNGNLDVTFNSTGKVLLDFGFGDDEILGVIIDGNGRIVVAGLASSSTSIDIALARFNANGTLDTTFGTGGKVVTPIGSGDDIAYGVVIDGSNRIVVAGSTHNGSNQDFVVVRYLASGALDTTFGSGGKVSTPIGPGTDIARDLALDGSGRIVVAGYASNGTNTDIAVVRYNTNGSLDTGFGTGGKVTTPIGPGTDEGYSVVLDGPKIVVAGRAADSASNQDFALVRFTGTGALDGTFGTGGKVTTPIGPGTDTGFGLVLDGSGNYIVAGSASNGSNNDFAVARYTVTGVLDPTFGTAGKVTTPIGAGIDVGQGVALDSQGRIVVAGFANFGNDDFAVVRYVGAAPSAPVATTTVVVTGNDLVITDVASGGKNDNLKLEKSGGYLQITDLAGAIIDVATVSGATGNGTAMVSVPLSAFTGKIAVNTLAGNDIVTVDASNTLPQIEYDGGTAGHDTLQVTGGSFGTVLQQFTGAGAGNFDLDNNGTFDIVYSNLEPVLFNSGVNDLILEITQSGITDASVRDYTGPGDGGHSELAFTGHSGEDFQFQAPSSALQIITRGGSTVLLAGFDPSFNTPILLLEDASGNASYFQLAGSEKIPNTSALTVTGNAVLDLAGFSETVGGLNGTGTVTNSAVGGSTLTVQGGGSFSGVIQDGGTGRTVALTKSGPGTLTLSGSNTYTGATTINGGALSVSTLANGGSPSNIGQAASAANNLILNGGTLQYTGLGSSTDRLFSVGTAGGTIAASGTGTLALTGNGALGFNSQSGPRTLTLAGNGRATLAAVIGDNGGATSINRTGTGSWVLSADNNSTGATSVTGGALLVNGSLTTAVTIGSGAVLGGTGSITGTVLIQSGGYLAPGTSPETLASGDLTLSSGSFLAVEIGGANPGDGSTGYDQQIVSGMVSLGGATLNLIQILGFTVSSAVPQVYTIIDNDEADSVVGNFNGLPEGAPITYAGGTLYISYHGGDGNDVVLSSTPTINGTAGNDTVVLRRSTTAGTIEFSLNGAAFMGLPDTLPFAFNGRDGSDLLLVDLSSNGGDPVPIGNISFTGESLRIMGGGTEIASFDPASTQVHVTGQGDIACSAVLEIDMLDLLTVNLQTATSNDTLAIDDGTTATNGGTLPADYNLAALAELAISGTGVIVGLRNAGTINLNTVIGGGDGDDTVAIHGGTSAHNNINLNIITGMGIDSVNFLGGITLGEMLTVSTATITDDGNNSTVATAPVILLTASGNVGAAGLFDLDINTDNLTISTAGGNQFVRESNGLPALQLDAGAGSIQLTVVAGSVFDSDTAVDIVASTVTVMLNNGAFGQTDTTAGNAIQTSVAQLSVATSGGSSQQFIRETDGLIALDLNAGASGEIHLFTGGTISDLDGSADVTGNTGLLTSGGAVGAQLHPIQMALDILSLTSVGNQFSSEEDSVRVLLLDPGAGNSVYLASGVFQLDNPAGSGVIPDLTPVTINTGATLSLNGQSEIIGSLADYSMNNGGMVSLTAGNTLTTGGNDNSTTFSGQISGPGALSKTGTGIFTLASSNDYSGTTTIQQGALNLTGKLTGNSPAGAIALVGQGTNLTSSNSLGEIANRGIVVTGTEVGISNLARITSTSLGSSAIQIQADASATLTGNSILDTTTGIQVANGRITLGAGNRVGGAYGTGLLITGNNSTVTGNTLSNTDFGLTTGQFITLSDQALSGPQTLSALSATFDLGSGPKTGAALTSLELNQAEAKIDHYLDDELVGLVVLRSNYAVLDHNNLLVIGSDAPNNIQVNALNPASVTVTITSGPAAPSLPGGPYDLRLGSGRICIFGLDGNDFLQVSTAASGLILNAELHGGLGNDTINGGAGHDVLYGEDGNDSLTGGAGNDVLVGGAGRDTLSGGAGEDLLLGGRITSALLNGYNYLRNSASLSWTTANMPAVLTAFAGFIDDAAVLGEYDLLSGGADLDGFLANWAGGGLRDLITDFGVGGIEQRLDLP